MSQDFNDPEIFADFIVEAKEHLETIEPNLLELEKSPENLDLCNAIFRPMHSLKGASGFLGLNTINRLAHKAENIMEELRKGAMPVTSEVMDVILSSTDALRQLIDNLEATGIEGEVDVDPIIATIEALLAGDIAPRDAGGVGESPPLPQSPPADGPAALADQSEIADAVTFTPYTLTTFGEGHLNDFLEEASEIISNLNSGLLELEKDPGAGGELVNDIFRYFHNLKGNSGIIGFKELNSLTHEAETLLNRVRKGEMESSHALIDLLLGVVDLIEALVGKVDVESGTVTPLAIESMVATLQVAVNEGVIESPRLEGKLEPSDVTVDPVVEDPLGSWNEIVNQALAEREQEKGQDRQPDLDALLEPAQAAEPPQEAVSGTVSEDGQAAPEADLEAVPEVDPEDVAVFESTVRQQLENLDLALKELSTDPEQSDYVDALFRSLTTLQNSSAYMGLDETKTYAERTAKLVDQARKSGIGFEPLLDIMRQEVSILSDMLHNALESFDAASAAPPPGAQAEQPDKESVTEQAPPVAVESAPPVEVAPAAPKPPAPAKPAARKVVPPAATAQPPKPEAPAPPKPRPAAPASPPPPATGGAQAQKPKVSSTIRVDHEKLDHLMNLIGELIINRNRFSMLARGLEEGKDVGEIAQSLTETTYAMARISDDLQDTIMKVRMVPVQTVFSRFPRLVRDLSRKSGKKVDLITEGEETELDKSVVEVIGDPLVHLIRNSVDHGIETEERRVAAGKDPVGKVFLRAYHRGNSVAIEVEDDGRGIDPEKMRESAINKGIITAEEAKNLDDREALELIFAPGFSTAEKVTDISGRGVGMDVVRTNIKNLKGSVNITSEVGKYSKFILSLPLTLAIIDALMVKVAGQTFAIPLDAVSETTKIEARRLTDVNNRKAVTLRGEVLGIVDLRELLEMPPREDASILSVLVIHDNDRRLGIIVDSLLERQEIVIKSLGSYLGDQKGLSGATIMGDGSVVLILDPHEIYIMATSKAL